MTARILFVKPVARSEEFLSDGLYISYDGEQYCLHAPRTANAVFLDDAAVKNFIKYVLKTKEESSRPPLREGTGQAKEIIK